MMSHQRAGIAFAAGLLAVALGGGAAEAGMNRLVPVEALGIEGVAMPAAMCGYSCRRGGRYIPGPPSVCYREGLRYCGSSRGAGPIIIERRRVFRDDDGFGRGGRGDWGRSRRGDRGWDDGERSRRGDGGRGERRGDRGGDGGRGGGDRGGPGPGWR